mgnify:CR=1 FL=1|jgi:hypothetical protein
MSSLKEFVQARRADHESSLFTEVANSVSSLTRRASETILSPTWWTDTLGIEDANRPVENERSWWEDYKVDFKPSQSSAEDSAEEQFERARLRWKQKTYSDDFQRGRGTLPIVPLQSARPRIKVFDTIHEADHPPTAPFAPRNLLKGKVLNDGERKRLEIKARQSSRANSSFVSDTASYTSEGTSIYSEVSSSEVSSNVSSTDHNQ